MQIKQIKDNKPEEITVSYLEGVLMPNGEFIHHGQCFFLKEDSKVFVEDKD